MSGRHPSIPPVVGVPPEISRLLLPMKESIERMRGERRGQEKIAPLPASATTDQIIVAFNKLLARIQD